MPTSGPFHDIASETLDASALTELQAAKLQALLKSLASNKFYKARLKAAGIKGADFAGLSFDQLPLLTKDEIVADQSNHPPFGSNFSEPLAAYCRFHQTSGSTGGSPIRWLDTPRSWEWMLQNWSHIYRAAGVTGKDRICFAFSFGPFIGFWTAFEAAVRYGALCFPAGGMSTSARLRFMLDNGITVLCCTPTYALRMAQAAAEEKVNIALSPVRLLLVAGEPGGSIPETRAHIEQAWGAHCADHYGMTEVGPASFQCEKHPDRMHIIETEFIAECLDRSGRPAPDGESGELVLTNLGRAGSPAIRYRTGDIVRMTRRSPCSCGRSFVSLDGGILGRADDMLIVRGVNIYPSAVENIIRRFPGVFEYRVEVIQVRSMSELKISIEPGPEEDGKALAKNLAAELNRALGIRTAAEAVPPGTLPRFEMKARRWVNSGREASQA